MIPLLRTLFDIVLLRKGPDAIPRSAILLMLSVGLLVFASLADFVLTVDRDEANLFVALFTVLIGVVSYAIVVVVSGRAGRLVQTATAIVGSWGVIYLAYLAEKVLLTPFLGAQFTSLIGTLTRLWSVPVEGHIIARAIDRHWYVGIVIAIAVFALQYVSYLLVTSPAQST